MQNDLLNTFKSAHGVVPKALSRLIRPALIAPEGRTLVWGDWSAIEARVLPWLSGMPGEVVLDVFRQNDADPDLPDIYKIEAGNVYGVDPTQVAKDQRQVGKVAVLALGFGGGVGALEAMATGYGISLDPDFQAEIVARWRASNAWAVGFWRDLMAAFHAAWSAPGTLHSVGRLAFVFMKDYLYGTMFLYLPDGRPLVYPQLRREKVTFEDDFGVEQTEWRIRYQKGYERATLWHGILAENPTQGVAASLLRALLVRLETSADRPAPAHPVAHTHDEAIIETDAADGPVAEAVTFLRREMLFVPDWAEGLPLAAEITENWFYSKKAKAVSHG